MARPHNGWGHDERQSSQSQDDRPFSSHRYVDSQNQDRGQQQHHRHQLHLQQQQQHRHIQIDHHQHHTREMVHLPGPSSLLTPISPPPLPPPPRRPVPLSAVVTAHTAIPSTRRRSYHGDYATPSPVGQTQPQMLVSSGDQHPMSGPMQQRRPVDHGLSPTQSSISSSDRSDELDLARYQTMGCSSMSSCSSPSSSAAAVTAAAFGAPFTVAPNPHNARTHDRTTIAKHTMANYDPRTFPRPGTGPVGATNTGDNALPPVQHTSPAASSPTPSHVSHASSPREQTKMSITNLLSSNTDDDVTAAPTIDTSPTRSKAPIASPFDRMIPALDPTYRIIVRQQPLAARSCGFGERDRRVVDPPPIVQLIIFDPNASAEENRERLNHPFYIMHCTIWSEDGTEDFSSMPEDYRQQRRLMGSLVSSPFVGRDENDKEGCFFTFPDLSCRTPGSFRLKFSLVVINPAMNRFPNFRSPIVATVFSNVFTVYNAKDFPGMQASTALTKRLKEQGCLISIKKGNEKANARAHRDDSDNEEDGDDDEGHGPDSSKSDRKPARKRGKTK